MQQSDPIAATVQICPRCGAEFSGGPGLKNLCPRCLMQSVLADSAAPDESAPSEEMDIAESAPGAQPDRNTPAGFQFRSGDRVLDGYTIVAPVGRGGFGEVYHARSDAGKDVALKFVQRFLEVEMRGVGHCLNLKHPNLVTIFDARPDSAGQQWIVMEFVAGRSLAHAIDRTPRGLPVEEILHWLEGITAAVEHLHESGIVHRDLKPSNIFDDRSTVKVGDYGLAKFITASRRSGQTQSIGTLHYMAPEIGCGRYGREVDVYAVGIMLYEMLTGDVPFDGETPAEILMKHLTAPPDLTMLPSAFRGIVGRMLAKRPEERYGSLRAVMADLKARLADAALDEQGPSADLPYYSSPGVSTWLEAPIASFQQQFGGGQIGVSDSSAGAAQPPRPYGRLEAAVHLHPVLSALCVFVTFAAFALAFAVVLYLLPSGGRISFPLWVLSFGAAASVVFCAWAFLLRERQTGRASDRSDARPGGDRSSDLTPAPRAARVTPTLRARPSDRADAQENSVESSHVIGGSDLVRAHSEPHDLEPAPPGTWTGVLGAILIALFWGIGTGLLVAGTTLLIWPRADDMAVVSSIGAGFFVAGVIAVRCLFSVTVSAFLRLVAALFFGACAGVMMFGWGLAMQARDEIAFMQGAGAGLVVAGMLSSRLFTRRPEWLLPRAFAGLLTGTGAGLLSAGTLIAIDARPDEFVALVSCGIGFFVVGGAIWFRLLLHTRRYALLRALAALFTGAGVGFLVAAVTLLGAPDEAAACLGFGAGFMACGIAAYNLFAAPRVRPAR